MNEVPKLALACYVLLDTSASMTGASHEALREGYQLIWDTVGDAFENTGWSPELSVLAYNTTITRLERRSSQDKTLNIPKPQGSSALGQALAVLREWIAEDQVPAVLVIVLTDGAATDNWFLQLQQLYALKISLFTKVIICAADHSFKLKTLETYFDSVATLSSYERTSFEDDLRLAGAKLQTQLQG